MEVSYQLSSPPEPGSSSPKSLLVRALEDWDIVTAQALLEEQQHQAWLLEHGWELVAVICCHLTEHTEEAGPHLTNCCQNLLTTLAERVTSAKEVSSAHSMAYARWHNIVPALLIPCSQTNLITSHAPMLPCSPLMLPFCPNPMLSCFPLLLPCYPALFCSHATLLSTPDPTLPYFHALLLYFSTASLLSYFPGFPNPIFLQVLVALLEQLDQFRSSLSVTRLLPSLGCTLLRLKERSMSSSWAWALDTLATHLR